MILIGQHGQWPLTIRNFYVVLITIKLGQLNIDRLEYYLLEFDQGGRKLNLTIYDGRKYDVQFPISYAKECIGVLQTLEWPIAIGGASVAYTDKRTTTGYTIVADASSAAYNSDLFYVAFGI